MHVSCSLVTSVGVAFRNTSRPGGCLVCQVSAGGNIEEFVNSVGGSSVPMLTR